jgi:hypothetical protein
LEERVVSPEVAAERMSLLRREVEGWLIGKKRVVEFGWDGNGDGEWEWEREKLKVWIGVSVAAMVGGGSVAEPFQCLLSSATTTWTTYSCSFYWINNSDKKLIIIIF